MLTLGLCLLAAALLWALMYDDKIQNWLDPSDDDSAE